MTDIKKKKLSFSQYVKEHSKYGSLREMFNTYIRVREGELPQSNKECRDEIEDAIAIFFKEENEKSSTKVQIKPEDFYLSLTVEDNKVLDFDIVIEHTDKSKNGGYKMRNTDKIDKDALLELCLDYDIKYGDYPESSFEGQALYEFLLCQRGEAVSQFEDYSSWSKRSDEYQILLERRRKKAEEKAEESKVEEKC